MSALWRVFCTVPDAASAEAAARALDEDVASVSAFEAAPGGPWLIEGVSPAEPAIATLETRLALAWLGRGDGAPALVVERLPARDWLAENQQSFPPIAVGRFFIHGSAAPARIPAGRIALTIDAAIAFGTGEHGSTRGCLFALDALARRGRRARVLDMGTGTGILAIAAAKTWHARVAAFDIDPAAVRVARRNAAVNGVGSLVEPHPGHSFAARAVRRRAPADLIFANILARPIIVLARGLSRALAPGGVAVLAGLLPWQEAAVLAAYRRVRLPLARRIVVDGWSTLVVSRSAKSL
jgi:ribosomal protein L11 methyltransferase